MRRVGRVISGKSSIEKEGRRYSLENRKYSSSRWCRMSCYATYADRVHLLGWCVNPERRDLCTVCVI